MGEEEGKEVGGRTWKLLKGRNSWAASGSAKWMCPESLGASETLQAPTQYLLFKNINTYTVFLNNQGKMFDFL